MHTCTDVITLKDVSNFLNGEWEAGEGRGCERQGDRKRDSTYIVEMFTNAKCMIKGRVILSLR